MNFTPPATLHSGELANGFFRTSLHLGKSIGNINTYPLNMDTHFKCTGRMNHHSEAINGH